MALANALSKHFAPDASVVAMSISTTAMAAESYGYMAPIKAALDSSVVFLAKSFSAFSEVRFNAVKAGPLKTSASAGIPRYLDNYLFAEAATLRHRGTLDRRGREPSAVPPEPALVGDQRPGPGGRRRHGRQLLRPRDRRAHERRGPPRRRAVSAGALALPSRAKTAPALAGYPFAPHYLDLGPARLHYVDEGRGDPVLFVHGNPTWSYLWRRPIAALAGRMRAIAPDHVGCGRSDKPEDYPYRLAQHIANLERLVLELDLQRVTLVVHDWGGPIGLGALLRHPERLARVLIANTAAFPNDSWGGRAPWRIRACRTPVFGELCVRGLNAFAGLAVRMAVERPLASEVRAGYLAPYASWGERVATQRFVDDIPLARAHPSYAALLEVEAALPASRAHPGEPRVGRARLVLHPRLPPRMAAAPARTPRSTRSREAGHYLLEDAPEEFQEHLEALLARPSA